MLHEGNGRAIEVLTPCVPMPAQKDSGGLARPDTQILSAPAPNLPGQDYGDTLMISAGQSELSGRLPDVTLVECAAQTVAEIVGQYRRYDDLRRAYQRIDLQVKAIQRSEGNALPVEVWLTPYTLAMDPLKAAIKEQEKTLSKLAKGLPVYDWAQELAGLSDRFLSMIIAEAARPLRDYRNPSCLWKRFGMAVIQGERQRKVSGDAALIHGYCPRRRSLMWNIGESILKQQIRKGEDGGRYAIGPYGEVYIDRRAYEAKNKGEKFSHWRAKRYMEKRVLRNLWRAWS